MMNPYQLNWPGLRDVPVVTIDPENGNIYSQENLLPIKRGKLDRIECKYVPIEAVLDEFNNEIELEEAFETLTNVLDMPGVKGLYTDKASGRKFVHVSSLLALVVVRPEDGPGFEMACNRILHFLTNHMEMSCLECGYVRRDCMCGDYEIFFDRSNIECVSIAKQTSDKNIQTDPTGTDGLPMESPKGATTVYLPPGTNFSDCERLPDGRINIRYVRTNNPNEKLSTQARIINPPSMVSSMAASGLPPGMILPPVSPYPMSSGSFVPPGIPPTNPYLRFPSPGMPMPPGFPNNFYANAYPSPYPNMNSMRPFNLYTPPQTNILNPQGKSILKFSPPSKDGMRKRSPTPSGDAKDEGNNESEVKRKRKGNMPMKNTKENSLKVKMGFKNLTSTSGNTKDKEESTPVPSKRLRRTRSRKDDEVDQDFVPVEPKEKKKAPLKKSTETPKTKKADDTKKTAEKKNSPEAKKTTSEENKKTEEKDKEKDNSQNDEETIKEESETVKVKEEITLDEKSGDIIGPDGKTLPLPEPEPLEIPDVPADNTVMDSAEAIEDIAAQGSEDMKDKPEMIDNPIPDLVIKEEVQEEGDKEVKVPKPKLSLNSKGFSLPVSNLTGKGWDVFEYAPTGQNIMRCLTCGQCFDKESYADKHHEMHTHERSLKCLECDYQVSYSKWYILLRHLYSKHQVQFVEQEKDEAGEVKETNSCKLCGNVFITVEELEEHVDAHHYNKYKCAYCGTSLLSWDAYQHHVQQECAQKDQGKIYYSCPYCHFAFRDRVMKQVHVKSHQDNSLVCCYCKDNKDWANWKLLKSHYDLLHLPKVKIRHPMKAKTCAKCNNEFKSYKGYKNHVAKCTGPKPVKEIPKEALIEEGEIVDNEGEKKVNEGGEEKEKKPGDEKEKDVAEVEKEKKVEEGVEEGEEKENKAEAATGEVSEDAKSAPARKETQPKVKAVVGNKCDKCHKRFGGASTLERHMVYAHGPEATCDECDHVAKSQMLLKMHKTLKHSEKRHMCSDCNRTFQYYHQYKVHLAWHARKVNYACPTCDKEFPRQAELRQHQLKDHPTANARTAFTCSECDFKCFSRTTLRAHLKNKHVSSDEDEGDEDDYKPTKPVKSPKLPKLPVQRTGPIPKPTPKPPPVPKAAIEAQATKEQVSKESSQEDDDSDEEDKASSKPDDSGSSTSEACEDSDSGSEVGEDDVKKIFSWRAAQPAPPGARRSQRTPKPSAVLKEIAKGKKKKGKKKVLKGPRNRRRTTSSSSPRGAGPTPRSIQVHKRLPTKRPIKKTLKNKKMKKEKVIKKIKIRRCGCARFRTYEEFKILKKRQQETKIVERTIVEDPDLPMMRRPSLSQDSFSNPPIEVMQSPPHKPDIPAPDVSWTSENVYSSASNLSPDERHQLFTIVLDHPYYQRPTPPNPPTNAFSIISQVESVLEEEVHQVIPHHEPGPLLPGLLSIRSKPLVNKRKRSAGTDPGTNVTIPHSPAKVRPSLTDLDSAMKYHDTVTQLNKYVSLLRGADKESPLPSTSGGSTNAQGTSTIYFQTPPKASSLKGVPHIVHNTAGHHHPVMTHQITSRGPLVGIPSTVQGVTPNRSYSSDYEMGELDNLPTDIMAGEIGSDVDFEGMMSEILQEMGQDGNNQNSANSSGEEQVGGTHQPGGHLHQHSHHQVDVSGVSADVSQAAEVLLSLDMSGEERELARQESESAQGLQTEEETAIVQSLKALAPHVHPPVTPAAATISYQPQVTQLLEETIPPNQVIVKNIPVSNNPRVAVELNNIDIPQNDFLFWAAKNDEDENGMVLRATENGEVSDPNENEKAKAWRSDHQYV